jgi:hypothetical protein
MTSKNKRYIPSLFITTLLMSLENAHYSRAFRDHDSEDRIWLNSTFRVELIKKGIDKAGSMNKLGRELGYKSRIHPGWSIRQILVGEQPFPFERLVKLSDYVGYPVDEVLKYRTEPRRITVENTNEALRVHGLWCYHVARLRLR